MTQIAGVRPYSDANPASALQGSKPLANGTPPLARAESDTVSLTDEIVLYRSKDKARKNPLTKTGESNGIAQFQDKEGKSYQYRTTDSPSIFTDRKGRAVYVRNSAEHMDAVAKLAKHADVRGKELANAPLPKYVSSAQKWGLGLGGIAGATAGAAINPAVGPGVGALAGGYLGQWAGGTIASGVANMSLHLDQAALRAKLDTLQETGVERRAETMRDRLVHGTSGTKAAIVECLLSSTSDSADMAGEVFIKAVDHATWQRGAQAEAPGAGGTTTAAQLSPA